MADVIIVGSGFAGLSAAIEADKAGASVIVIEKRPTCGGNSAISGGTLTVTGSAIQERENIEDSVECLVQDMMTAGEDLNDSALVRIVAKESYATFLWLVDYLGVQFKDRVDQYGGHSVPRNHTPITLSGSSIIEALLTKAKKLNVDIRTSNVMKRLLIDKKGRVIGVEVVNEVGVMEQLMAQKGVILATGGFAGDREFQALHAPYLPESLDHTNQPNATGEVLSEAMRIGAKGIDLDQIQLVPWTSPDEKGYGIAPYFGAYTVLAYGLAIDPATGKRFINELADRKIWTDTLLDIGHPCIGIADATGIKNSGVEIEAYLDEGIIKKFEDLASLAEAYKIPSEELRQTVNLYNQHVIKQEDTEFGKPLRDQVKPLQYPYYSVRFWPKVHYTMGGLKIDAQARVIGENGHPIPGLYAAGEVTGGIHGACRLGGCAMTECLVFGRVAGTLASKN